MSSPDPQAVFLSYASQDAAAVRRIAEALRAAGIEVWFDQNELVGGDAWDAKIRKQLAECALFVPVISAATQARLEGYFRLEWKLAAQRTHTMADEKVFLLPVVIDDTRDTEAKVPTEFKAVQWTRLRPVGFGGQARDDASVAAFCARIGKVLGGEGRDASPRRPSSEVDKTPGRLGETSLPAKASRPWLVPVILGVTAVAVLALWRPWRETAPPRVAPASVSSQPSNSASAPVVAEKSLVVLPLENLSPDPENAFFTDGTHIEIISTLSRIADLTVMSRDSAIEFKASPEPLAEKAKKLGIANVLTGSVRRAGNDIRIVLELRRASDQALLWTQTYNKQLGEGVLAIQADIADQVARVLQARERKGAFAGAQYMTKNPQAYDLFLNAREQYLKDRSGTSTKQVVAWLNEALTLDPAFVSAARFFVTVLLYPYRDQRKSQEEREQIKRDARRWADTAARLAPGGAGDDALATYFVIFERDPSRALPYAENAARALPNDAAVQERIGLVYWALGRITESEARYRRAIALDPFNYRTRSEHLLILSYLRRTREFEEFDAEHRRTDRSQPASWENTGDVRYRLYGTPPDVIENVRSAKARVSWLLRSRKWTEAIAEVESQLTNNAKVSDGDRHRRLIERCDALRRLGRDAEARQAAEESKIQMEKANAQQEIDPSLRDLRQAMTLSRLGESAPALAAMQRYVNARNAEVTPLERVTREVTLAEFYAYLNRPRECVELLAKLLRVPSGLTVPMLNVDPAWDNVREDPAFQALLADPKNSAPL